MQAYKIKWTLLILLFLSIPVSATQDVELRTALVSAMQQHKIPDLSVGIIRAGKSEYSADLHRNSDGTVHIDSGKTLFRIASITKIFTAQAIMQLVEQRKISLDDKASLYVPELRDSDATIRHLMTHYGGFIDRVWPEPYHVDSEFNAYLSKLLKVNQNSKAGVSFQYSDTGFNLLGNIISRVSGMTYSAYIERNILRPVGMLKSGYYSGANGLMPTVEPFKNGQLIPQDQRWPFDPQFFPAEGLITNINELNRWVKSVLQQNPKLLKKESYQQMIKPSRVAMDASSIGLGWFRMKRNGKDYVYHMGGIRGYESIIVMNTERRDAIILLTNASDTPRWEIVDLIETLTESDIPTRKVH